MLYFSINTQGDGYEIVSKNAKQYAKLTRKCDFVMFNATSTSRLARSA